MSARPCRQRGATLIVSLIMLLLITLLAISSFTLGKGNLQVVGNMQQRQQAFGAAQSAVATVISTTQFTATPTDAITNPCGGSAACVSGNVTVDCNGPNTTCVDVNGDGLNDVNVGVTVTCDSIQPIPVTALDFTNPNDAGCLVGASQNTGVAGASNQNSMCSNSVWDVQASATDVVSAANAVIDQGVAVRVPSSAACP
jgi:Tfp pilus assembly protein PilX